LDAVREEMLLVTDPKLRNRSPG